MLELLQLRQTVVDSWPFTPEEYSVLARPITDLEKLSFTLNHVAQHMMKASGYIAQVVEPMDHGEPLNRELLLEALCKMQNSILRISNLTGISILELVEESYKVALKNSRRTS